MIKTIQDTGIIGMDDWHAQALAAFRSFNYETIYLREASERNGKAVVGVLRGLVEYFAERPEEIPGGLERGRDLLGQPAALHEAVAYVAGMTDRFACRSAVTLLNWPMDQLPSGIDR
jgi:dGTPase